MQFPVEHQHAVNEYGFYVIPDCFKDREVAKTLLKGAVNEPRTLNLMRRLVGRGDIVSGGAFIGDFLPPLVAALADDAFLHSFEPNPPAFDAANAVIALNSLQGVNLHAVAVGEAEGVLPLQVAAKNGRPLGGMSKIVQDAIKGQTIDVPVKRIDDLVPKNRRVSIIQLDIEGFEWQALLGAKGIIERDRPIIILETLLKSDTQVTAQMLHDIFPDAGYELMGIMERNSFFTSTVKADISRDA